LIFSGKNKQKITKENVADIRITNYLIRWVCEYGFPISATDFTGYLFGLYKHIWAAVDRFGKLFIYSKNPKKPMTEKTAIKYLNKLLKHGFITATPEPFEEFYGVDIPFDYDKVYLVEEPLFPQHQILWL
jgi:hypothetical protein